MNPLRNPIVVGILAVVAVGVIVYQTFGAKFIRPGFAEKKLELGSAKSAPPAAPAPAPVKPGVITTIPAATYTNLAEALDLPEEVDAATVETRFNTWVSAPLRDPFLLLRRAVEEPSSSLADTNSPVPGWTLTAIWNQTGSRVAVIDTSTNSQPHQRVYQAGDYVVENYKVLRIERDEVWIQGPRVNERLGFASSRVGAAPPVSPVTTTRN